MQLALILAVGAAAVSAAATDGTPEAGLRTAVAACEAWLLEPSTWTDGVDGFPARAKLATLQPQATVPDVALPPARYRRNLHSWRVPVGEGGYFVTMSDTAPICHIAGGGPTDFQPPAATLLRSPEFQADWKLVENGQRGDMTSSRYVNKKDDSLSMIVSHARQAGGRTDRVQVVATAVYGNEK